MFRRERLFRELDLNREVACTWVAGPPGAGKTALVASFASDRASTCLWYQIDPDDGDPSAFFGQLANAAVSVLGEPATHLPRLTADATLAPSTFARRFFRELFALTPELLLVLDDYHQVAINSPLHDIVRLAIEQAPSGTHIAVVSRTHPPSALARCQANGAIRSISWSQLMLTPDEVIGVAGVHDVALDTSAADKLHVQCGGWAAGLRLLLRANAPTDMRVAEAKSPALMFDYLDREVFFEFPAELQSLLRRLAFLPRIPATILNHLGGSPTAERQMAALADENLFTTVTAEGPPTYRFHPLFQDFLIHRATWDLPAEEVLADRYRAATALEAGGLIEDAVQMLIDAKAWGRLEQLAVNQAPRLMSQGRQLTLERWLTQLPVERVAVDAWLSYWLGRSRSLHDPFSGRRSLEAAFDLFAKRQHRAGLLLAWSGVVDCIFRIYSNLGQLDDWIARLEALLEADPRFPTPEVEAQVTFSMFVALSFRQPQHAGLAKWRQRLDAIAGLAPDPMFRMFARLHLTVDHIWQGDLQAAEVDLRTLKRETAVLPVSPLAKLIGYFAESTYFLYTGERVRCFDAIENALATADVSGIHMWDKILLGQGAALALNHGDLGRGHDFAIRRTAIVKPLDDEEQSLHHVIEAWSYWLRGKPADALAHARLSSSFGERMGLPYFKAVGSFAASIVRFECGDEQGALRQVEVGRSLGELIGNPMLGWMADLLQAYMQLQLGREATALVESCMKVGKKHGYRYFFFWPRKAISVVCFKALELNIEPDYVNDLIEVGQLAAPPEALGSERWPWPVKVLTLGTFSVVVHGTAIAFKGKAQRAPLGLLKALIAFGGHRVTESRVVDALWPDSDGAAGEQALATTLFRLRKLVGADVVRRHDGHLSIVAAECWIDCWALERLLGSAAVDLDLLLERVKSLYVGPFLQGEDDAPWALQLRERLHVALVRKMSSAAADALAQNRLELAGALYDAGLEIDDLVEEFYRGQMQCHLAADQPSLAATTYRRCQRILSSRLGVEPSHATTRLYVEATRAAGT